MRQQTLRALDEADVVVFVVDAREGRDRRRQRGRQAAAQVAASRCWSPPTRSTATRREARPPRGLRARLPATSSRSRPATAAASAICSTRWWRACPRRRRRGRARRRRRAGTTSTRPLRHRLRRQAQRRQVVAGQLPAGRGARAGPRRSPGPRAIRSTRRSRSAGASTCWSTPRACAAAARSTRCTEHVAAKMARDQLDRCDVAVLVVDAREGATAEDARLASLIEDSGRGALVVLNKKDLVGRARHRQQDRRHARGAVVPAPTRRCWSPRRSPRAGVTGDPHRGVAHLRGGVAARLRPASSTSCSRTSSPASRRPPVPAGRHVRLYYATQAERPPAHLLRQHQPPRRHRLRLPPLPDEPAAQGLRLRRHARPPRSSAPTSKSAEGAPRAAEKARARQSGRQSRASNRREIRRAVRAQKILESARVAENGKGLLPRFKRVGEQVRRREQVLEADPRRSTGA